MSILRNFNLPIVDKSVVSQQRADPVIDASSISSYGQRGTTTVLSRPSDNDRTNSTALSWHEPIRSVASGIDQSMGDSTRNFGANFGSLLPRQSSNVVLRPGPSLLESIVHVNHHNDHSSEQYFHTDTSQPRNFNLDLLNDRREGLLRRTLFDGRAIDFSNEVVSPVRRLDLSARAPTPSWLSEIPPEYDNAPPSGQKRMYKPSQELSQVPKPDQIDITSTHMLKSNHNSNAGAQATNNSQQDAMSTRLTVNKRSIGTNRAKSSQSLLPKKAGATKRGSRKNFVSAATQTGYKSVPKTTQTDPVEVTPIEDDEAPNKSFPNFTQGQGNTILGSLGASLHQQNKPAVIEDMIMTETQILLRRSALRINKFSSRGNFNSSPTQDVDARLTSLEEDKSLFLPLAMQNHKQRRSGNKFARRRNLSEA